MPFAMAAPVPLGARATDTAAPTASAVICALSVASRVTEPASAWTLSVAPTLAMNAATELVMLLLASEPAPDSATPFLPPPPEAAAPMVQASMLPLASAVSAISLAAVTLAPSIEACTVLAMLLSAIAAPTEALPPVLFVPAAIDTATPPASALMVEWSVALSSTSPLPVAVTVPPLMPASMVTWMLLTDPAPAPASAPLSPLPLEPEPAAEPPMVSASMVAVELALRLTSPAAFTVEFSMVALTNCPAPLPISLSATDAPTAPEAAGPLPLVAAMLIAKPPASEWILEPSLAPRYTVPAVLLAGLSLMEAHMVLRTLLLAPEPAPASAAVSPEPPLLPAPEAATPKDSASIFAVAPAVSESSAVLVTVEPSTCALTVLVMLLVAIAAPTEAEPEAELEFFVFAATETATPPASALIAEPSLAMSSTLLPLCVALTVLPAVIPASTVCVIVLVDPAPAPANAPVRPPEDDPGVGVGEGDGLGVGLGEGLGVAVGSGMGSGLGVGVGLGLGDGVGDGEPPEPAPESAAPMVHASIDAVESAVSVTVPKADTVELSMKARMLLWMLLSLSEAPTDRAPELPPPGAPPAESAGAPASAVIELLSVAEMLAVPVVVTVLPAICASTVLVTLLSDSAPAPESAALVPCPPAPVTEPPSVNAWISAVDVALTLTGPPAEIAALSSVAFSELVISLSLIATPTEPPWPPLVSPEPRFEMVTPTPPAMARGLEPSIAVRGTPPVVSTPLPLT